MTVLVDTGVLHGDHAVDTSELDAVSAVLEATERFCVWVPIHYP